MTTRKSAAKAADEPTEQPTEGTPTEWYAPNQQAVRPDGSGPAETGEGGSVREPEPDEEPEPEPETELLEVEEPT